MTRRAQGKSVVMSLSCGKVDTQERLLHPSLLGPTTTRPNTNRRTLGRPTLHKSQVGICAMSLLAVVTSVLGLNMASECGVVNDRCGYDDAGNPVRDTHLERGHPSIVFHPEDHAHECCDGLMCESGVCHRPWGTAAPDAQALKAVYDRYSPGTGMDLERAAQMLIKWSGREERLLTSVRLKHELDKRQKDEV